MQDGLHQVSIIPGQIKRTETEWIQTHLIQKLSEGITACRKNQKLLKTESNQLFDKADKLSDEAEAKHSWTHLIEGNALRTKGKQKCKAAEAAKMCIEQMEKKLKLLKYSLNKVLSIVSYQFGRFFYSIPLQIFWFNWGCTHNTLVIIYNIYTISVNVKYST